MDSIAVVQATGPQWPFWPIMHSPRLCEVLKRIVLRGKLEVAQQRLMLLSAEHNFYGYLK